MFIVNQSAWRRRFGVSSCSCRRLSSSASWISNTQAIYDPNDPSTFPSTVPLLASILAVPFQSSLPSSLPILSTMLSECSHAQAQRIDLVSSRQCVSAGPSPVGGMTAMRIIPLYFIRGIKVCAGYHIRRQNYAERGVPSLFASPPIASTSHELLVFSRRHDLTLPEIKRWRWKPASQGKNAQFDIQVNRTTFRPV